MDEEGVGKKPKDIMADRIRFIRGEKLKTVVFFEKGLKLTEVVKYGFLLFLLLVAIASLDFSFIRPVSSFLLRFQTFLTVMAIVLGALTFWLNKDKIDEIEEEENAEVQAERKRGEEFGRKYPKVNKIPVLRSLVKWMYKEGWWYSVGLIVILLVGFGLRAYNLNILDPYTDEYSHLVAAKELVETGATDYTRASLVTSLVAFFFRLGNASSFYEYVFWGRIPGVIFGALTIIPLYFLARKISKKAGIVSAILWITSPWAIGVSKTIREYTFYPFFILIFCLVFMYLIKNLFEYKRENLTKIIIAGVFVILFVYWGYRVDYLSSLKMSFLLIPIIITYYFIVYLKELKKIFSSNKKLFLYILCFILISFIFTIFFIAHSSQITISEIKGEMKWLDFFFSPNKLPMHWWYGVVSNYLVYFFVILCLIYVLIKKKQYGLLNLMIFIGYLTFFIYFFDRYLRQRYTYYVFPFFVIIISLAIIAIRQATMLIQGNKMKLIALAIFTLFIFTTFQYQNTLYPLTSNAQGYVKTTNEYHDKLNSTLAFFKDRIQEDDIFITTFFGSVLRLEFDIEKERIYYYTYDDEERFNYVEEVVSNYSRGWIILDWRRNGYWTKGYPKKGEFKIGNTTINTLFSENIQVYHWDNNKNSN